MYCERCNYACRGLDDLVFISVMQIATNYHLWPYQYFNTLQSVYSSNLKNKKSAHKGNAFYFILSFIVYCTVQCELSYIVKLVKQWLNLRCLFGFLSGLDHILCLFI